MNNYTTLNNPKHLVTLGRPAPKRIKNEEYLYMVDTLLSSLRRFGINRDGICTVQSCRNRTSYGDIDILILESVLPANWEKSFSTHIFNKGFWAKVPETNITVFEYTGYQVNIHTIKGGIEELLQAKCYLRYEGLSGLIEILANNLGFKYDSKGLYLKTNIPKAELLKINRNDTEHSSILGFSESYMDYYIYTQNDSFDCILKSNFFNRNVFLELESKSDYSEILARYPIVGRFLQYLKTNTNLAGESKFDINEARHRKQFTKHIAAMAPDVYAEYNRLWNTHKKSILISEKFNPEVVTTITGLQGEEVLQFMDTFAKSFKGETQFNLFILTSLPSTLSKALLDLKVTIVKPVEDVEEIKEEVVETKEAEVTKPPKKSSTKKASNTKGEVKAKKSEVEKPKAKAKAKAKKTATTTVPRALPVVSEPADNSFALAA